MFEVAKDAGKWQVILEIGDGIYRMNPIGEVALINAEAHAHEGEERPAIGWLQCAGNDGIENLKEYTERPTFDPIRQSTLFQEWLQK